ncbi:MAG: DUF4124 domain-containing protein [Candidatus Thiodiazotropha sp. (ex Lucinoma kastoroae)]|nr:DUF4124 domain-containing protein [Candidatus Thiodiazotropha sp. (ex Lucinoma kastoroae)]MCU7860385.1 DUF4124 domain-containing protein [Candidatus Thiodiazotropha sp. (ex Lucinoma kastoroae)]
MKQHLFFALIVLFSTTASAEIYRWVNEDGVVIFSRTPPPGAKAETVKIRNSSPSSANDSEDRLKKLHQRLADSEEDRGLKKAKQREQAEDKARNKQNCNAARKNLEQLTALANRLYKVGDEYLRLTEEDRQKRMQQARDQIKEHCKR